MVFAINPPPNGDKSFSRYKMKAMGGSSSTIVSTKTDSKIVSVTYSARPGPPAPAPSMTMIPTDEQCQCVCNVDVNNGAPNPLQGSLGHVQRILL